jgi:hypothetical protein
MQYYQCMVCRKTWSEEELSAEMTTPYTCLECGTHTQRLSHTPRRFLETQSVQIAFWTLCLVLGHLFGAT